MKNDLDTLKTQSDMENDILKSKLESGLINQEEYENNRIALAQKAEEEKLKIQKVAFEKNKRLQTAQAIINGALAITKIMAEYPKFDFGVATAIGIGAQAVSTGIQVATIQSQQFAKGGQIQDYSGELINGNRNIKTQSNGDNILATVKAGEVVLNEEQQKRLGGYETFRNIGVPGFASGGYIRKYANGGLIQNNGISMQDLKQQSDIFASAINNLKVINVASDTIGTYDNAKRIENEFTF